MFDHLRYKGGTVVGTSMAGNWTIEKLDLNDPDVVEFRSGLIGLLNKMEGQIIASTNTENQLKQKLKTATKQFEINEIEGKLAEAEKNTIELQELVDKIIG